MVGIGNSSSVDSLADQFRYLERRIARLERGTSGSPSTDPVIITSLAITGLTLSTQTVNTANDFYNVMMRYSWTAVPNDPSEYNKDALDGYLTSWSIDGTHYTADLFTTNTFLDVGPFTQGQSVTFRVRARTIKGTIGNYTTLTNTTTTDSTAPFQPSTPVVSPYLGQLAIDWDGLDVSSNPMPTDFRFCEVHLSTTSSTFTPTTATLVGTILRGGGTWIATGLAYGTLQYARLVCVDTVGNRSVTSTAGSGTPVQAANGDISALSIGKLTVGTLAVNMTVGARIMTASTGARVELNTNGLQAFNSSGTQTVDIASATGNVVITGSFQTDFPTSTTPHLYFQNSGDRTSIFFTDNSGAGTNYAFMNTPADAGNVPQLGANSGVFTYLTVASRHRLFLANGNGITLETIKQTGGAAIGGRMTMTGTAVNLDVRDSSGNQTGGSFSADTGQAIVAKNVAGAPVGGVYTADANYSHSQAFASGSMVSEWSCQTTGQLYIAGLFYNNQAISNNATDAIIAGSASTGLGPSTAFAFAYGATVPARPGVVYAYFSSTNASHRLSAFSTTGFTVTTSASVTCNIEYWAWRQ